ncbi:MAG: hypothetical protein HC929_19395 [Leptolyngbyaceae cyanobacterium SM2_5_2]|nr:hypothetical protein [Leptolyngbyaceae cyanobacterium SM2_5_2]
MLGLSVGLGVATVFFTISDTPVSPPWSFSPPPPLDKPFKQGADKAMTAAELTQTAEFKEEWVEVVLLWQEAIAQMQAVPKADSNYAVARQKVDEYSRNLQYAQSNVNSRAARTPTEQNYWTIGSDRDWLMALQGSPSQVLRYDSACNEVLRYGNSIVELSNGYVKQYANLDGNLRVLADAPVAPSTQGTSTAWSLGSSREEVLQLQGTPSRTDQYASEQHVTLYYGNSSVLLEDGYVVSYWNADQNLRVSTALASSLKPLLTAEKWSIGSSRAEVLKIQGDTPKAFSRNDGSCEEILHFGRSEVILRQGFVVGYKNTAKNLRVR